MSPRSTGIEDLDDLLKERDRETLHRHVAPLEKRVSALEADLQQLRQMGPDARDRMLAAMEQERRDETLEQRRQRNEEAQWRRKVMWIGFVALLVLALGAGGIRLLGELAPVLR